MIAPGRPRSLLVTALSAAIVLSACGNDGPAAAPTTTVADDAATTTVSGASSTAADTVATTVADTEFTTGATTAAGAAPAGDPTEPELRAELLAMLDEDQAERTGESAEFGDERRTERLAEIVDEYGWPTITMVGADGATAAWAIAQHSDLDPEFQAEVLPLLEAAVEAGEASPGDYAYLYDRVAVGRGDPQRYGTQVGCNADGEPETATPIEDADAVEQRRADAGLDPLADYLDEMTEICAGDFGTSEALG